MKTLKISFSLFVLCSFLNQAFSANTGNPQEVNIKIYELWATPNADCTDLVKIYDNPTASYQDMVVGPTFDAVTVNNGTYNCIAWKMSDIISFRPDYTSTGLNCQQGTLYTRDLFRASNGDTSTTPAGATITATDSVVTENTMYIYLSVNGDNANNCNHPNTFCKLNNAYVVSGENTAIMVTDFTNGIEDTGGSCSPETVSFSFRYQ